MYDSAIDEKNKYDHNNTISASTEKKYSYNGIAHNLYNTLWFYKQRF